MTHQLFMASNTSQSPDLPTVFKFTASHCGPCRQLEPLIEELAARYDGVIEVVTIDIEEEPELAQRFRVRAVPTLLAVRGEEILEQQVGFSNRGRVESLFAALASA